MRAHCDSVVEFTCWACPPAWRADRPGAAAPLTGPERSAAPGEQLGVKMMGQRWEALPEELGFARCAGIIRWPLRSLPSYSEKLKPSKSPTVRESPSMCSSLAGSKKPE